LLVVGCRDSQAALEAACTVLGEYQPSIVPGLLQTPAYARQMIGPSNNPAGGSVTCRILVDGKVFREATSDGAYVIASCSGSVP